VNVGSGLVRLAPTIASMLVLTVDLPGQTVSGRAVIAAPRSSVRLGGARERMDGLWGGLAFDFQAGRFTLSGSGTRGRLAPSPRGTAPKQDVGELSLAGQYALRPWFRLDLEYTARAFSSAAGYQRWNIVGLGATVARDLGTRAVRAYASVAYLSAVTVSGQRRPTFAVGSDVGLVVTPDRVPIALLLTYRIERFHFPGATARSEQFEALTVSLGVRARRDGGRWTLGAARK
jgi:hypothetical protein